MSSPWLGEGRLADSLLAQQGPEFRNSGDRESSGRTARYASLNIAPERADPARQGFSAMRGGGSTTVTPAGGLLDLAPAGGEAPARRRLPPDTPSGPTT